MRVKLEVVRTVEPRCGRRNRSHCPGLRRRTLAQSGDATATLRIVGVGAPAEPARTGTLTFSAAAQRVYPLTIHAVDGQGRYATTTTLFFIQSAQGAELVDLVGLRQRAFRARYESALAHTGGETAGLGGLDLIPSVTVVEGDPVGQNSIHVKTRVAGTRPFVSGSPVPQSEPLAALTVCLVQVTRLPLLPQFWRTLGCSETDLNGWADIEVNDPYSPDLTLIVRTENHNIELSASQTMVFTAGGFQFDPLVLSDLLAMCPGLWCVRADVPPLRSNGIASALINITLEPGSLSNEFVINSEDDTGFGFNVFNEVVKARRAFDSLGVPPRSSLGAVGDLLKVRYPGGYGGQDASQYGGCTPGADVPCYRVGSGVMWLPPVVFHSGPPRATGENALDDASLRAVHHEFGHYVMDMTYGHRVGSGAPEVCEVAEPGTSVGDCDPQLPGVVFVSHSPDGLCGNATALSEGWANAWAAWTTQAPGSFNVALRSQLATAPSCRRGGCVGPPGSPTGVRIDCHLAPVPAGAEGAVDDGFAVASRSEGRVGQAFWDLLDPARIAPFTNALVPRPPSRREQDADTNDFAPVHMATLLQVLLDAGFAADGPFVGGDLHTFDDFIDMLTGRNGGRQFLTVEQLVLAERSLRYNFFRVRDFTAPYPAPLSPFVAIDAPGDFLADPQGAFFGASIPAVAHLNRHPEPVPTGEPVQSPDLLVAAPLADDATGSNAGALVLFDGCRVDPIGCPAGLRTATPTVLRGSPIVTPPNSANGFGYAVALGDLRAGTNQQLTRDVVVLGQRTGQTESDHSEVAVLFGDNSANGVPGTQRATLVICPEGTPWRVVPKQVLVMDADNDLEADILVASAEDLPLPPPPDLIPARTVGGFIDIFFGPIDPGLVYTNGAVSGQNCEANIPGSLGDAQVTRLRTTAAEASDYRFGAVMAAAALQDPVVGLHWLATINDSTWVRWYIPIPRRNTLACDTHPLCTIAARGAGAGQPAFVRSMATAALPQEANQGVLLIAGRTAENNLGHGVVSALGPRANLAVDELVPDDEARASFSNASVEAVLAWTIGRATNSALFLQCAAGQPLDGANMFGDAPGPFQRLSGSVGMRRFALDEVSSKLTITASTLQGGDSSFSPAPQFAGGFGTALADGPDPNVDDLLVGAPGEGHGRVYVMAIPRQGGGP